MMLDKILPSQQMEAAVSSQEDSMASIKMLNAQFSISANLIEH